MFFIRSIVGLGDCVLCWIWSEIKGINVELKSYLGVLLVRETVCRVFACIMFIWSNTRAYAHTATHTHIIHTHTHTIHTHTQTQYIHTHTHMHAHSHILVSILSVVKFHRQWSINNALLCNARFTEKWEGINPTYVCLIVACIQ